MNPQLPEQFRAAFFTSTRAGDAAETLKQSALAGRLAAVRAANPNRRRGEPCVYVGMSGLTPEERFANHKQGIKAAAVVQRYGLRLLPELYAHLNPMPYEAAAQMEKDLAEDLRRDGYSVTGGH